jgi:NAD(P) transhydrogenase subunit alpha
MKVGVPAEVYAGERRVAATPDSVARLKALGFEVLIEHGAGVAASFTDDAYAAAGAQLIPEARDLWAQADVILKVRPPMAHPADGHHEADLLRRGQALISFIWPAQNPDLIDRLTASQARVWAMDAVPRISRAQRMDALSSMANIAGYRAVIEAAQHFGRFFTGQITAGGKSPRPPRCWSSAQASRAWRRLARRAGWAPSFALSTPVRSFEEQVQSMGAEFLEVDGRGRHRRRRLRPRDEPRLHRRRDGAVCAKGARG